MMRNEAVWIGAQLAKLPAESLSPVLELGSSTARYRQEFQPYIDSEIHKPLRERGVQVVHSDAKMDEGVDIAGDMFDPQVHERLREVGARCLLACNLFEHVADRAELAEHCDSLLSPGGFLVVTVPNSFPLHFDPIDTYYRPTPLQVAELFPGYRLVASETVECGSYVADIVAGGVVLPFIRLVGKLVVFRGARRWVAQNHSLFWLWRTYRVAAVVLQKPS